MTLTNKVKAKVLVKAAGEERVSGTPFLISMQLIINSCMEISRMMRQVCGCSGSMPALSPSAKDPYLVALGAQIRALRLAQGWSQDEFAARAGMHRTHPTKLENGLLDPRLSTLRRIAKVLAVEVATLLPVG